MSQTICALQLRISMDNFSHLCSTRTLSPYQILYQTLLYVSRWWNKLLPPLFLCICTYVGRRFRFSRPPGDFWGQKLPKDFWLFLFFLFFTVFFNLWISFFLYYTAFQHPAQKASTQRHVQPASTDIWENQLIYVNL